MSRIRRISPGLGRGGLLGNTEGPEAYLRELDSLPSQFCRATGGTETVINQSGRYYRVHTYTDTDPTSLLLNFDGSNGSTTFTDDSGWGHTVTANGNSAISTTQSKFGGSSLYLDGTGDYLSVPDSPLFEFGSGDFTVECWFYIAGNSAQNAGAGLRQAALVAKTSAASSGFLLSIDGNASTTGTAVGVSAFSSGSQIFGASYVDSISQSTWHHVAACKSGTNLYLFFNGSQVALSTGVTSSVPDLADSLLIGRTSFPSYDNYFNGYIDSLRITKGQALYTAAFTPPTTALTRVGSGSLAFTRGGSVEYLVVGGGGGGGIGSAGGGGAGGFRLGSVTKRSGFAHAVAVGGGGAGATGTSSKGANGAGSQFSLVASAGGGGGGSQSNADGASGGSGGGSRGSGTPGTGNSPSVSPSQGNDGGDGSTDNATYSNGGGGGGASAVGGDATSSNGGNGGDGSVSGISGTSLTYAGGGGGGAHSGGSSPYLGGAGGDGGGGDGGDGILVSVNADSGVANTGGGGGGGGYKAGDNVNGTAGSGGSGIVIARYRITQAEYEAEAA